MRVADSDSRDLTASGRVSAAIFGSRLLGLAREVVFAALFGAGAVADAFITAFRIPNLFRDLLAEGALTAAFVPTFTATLKQDGEEAAARLGDLMFGAMVVLTGTMVGAGLFFAEPIVALISGIEDPDKLALTVELTRVMMPLLCTMTTWCCPTPNSWHDSSSTSGYCGVHSDHWCRSLTAHLCLIRPNP